MADIANTAANVRPMVGTIIRRFPAGGALTVGDAVYVDSTGAVQKAIANSTVLVSEVRGIVVSVQPVAGTLGQTTAVSGDRVDVCMYGPLEFAPTANLTPGGPLWLSATTAGRLDQTKPATVGWFPTVVGFAESATRVFVNPPAVLTIAN